METNEQKYYIEPEEDEIDIAEVFAHLWYGRKTIILIICIFVALGFLIAITGTPQYKAQARILPEVTQSVGLSGGFMIDPELLRPSLYPNIVGATPFFIDLLDKEIYVPGLTNPITVFEYVREHMGGGFSITGIIKKYTIGLPGTVIGWFRSSSDENNEDERILNTSVGQPVTVSAAQPVVRLSQTRYNAIRTLRSRIQSSMDRQTQIMTISAEFPDPYVAAQITRLAMNYLHNYVIISQVEKAKNDVAYLEELFFEKQEEVYEAQMRLARFQDANRNVLSSTIRTEEQRLEHQYILSFELYQEVAKELEQARIQLQKETPVIQILEDVQVPLDRSKPKRTRTMMIFSVVGVVAGIGFVLVRWIARGLVERIKNYNPAAQIPAKK